MNILTILQINIRILYLNVLLKNFRFYFIILRLITYYRSNYNCHEKYKQNIMLYQQI